MAKQDVWRRHCAACGATDELHRHHLVPRSLGGEKLPTVMLCGRCHAAVHTYGGAMYFGHRELTLAGLARARAAGKRLGNPNLRPGDKASAEKGRAIHAALANERAASLAPALRAARAQGAVSLREIADFLMRRGIKTPRGLDRWHPQQVSELARRCSIAVP
jgi:hypothetical protein